MTAWMACGDESIRRRSYWLGAALVPVREVPNLNQLMRSLHLRGQRQLHCKSEGDPRRRAIISALVGFGSVRGLVYRAPRPVVEARASCLRALIGDLIDKDVSQLVLDRVDEHQGVRDRVTIRESLRKHGADLQYQHASPWEYAGVQVADVIAWAYGAGGDWRRRIRPIIDKVADLER
jgi:hypothetical protein